MDTKFKMILCGGLILFGIIEVICICNNDEIKDNKKKNNNKLLI